MEIEELKKRVSELSIGISRVPKNTKKEFINLANAEFAGDYGMTLQFILQQAFEYQEQKMKWLIFENMDNKLNNILEIISQTEQKEISQEVEFKKTLGGKRIELKGGDKKK